MAPPTSPGGPSSTTWRRERLLRIGTSPQPTPDRSVPATPSSIEPVELSPSEHTSLQYTNDNGASLASYGTIPARRRPLKKDSFNNFSSQRSLSQFPSLSFLNRTTSNSSRPRSPSILRDLAFSRLSVQRPISAYDAPLRSKDDIEPDADAKINGIRVWYSSFSSIDWLHDAIKDSARFSRLRRRKSVRARVRLAIDKSLGWFIVTIVGFLTAVVAFLIVRGEQWLFDTKDGYCREAWWRAKRFCCPETDDIVRSSSMFARHLSEDACAAWRPWADVFSQRKGGTGEHVVEYMSYALIAVSTFFLFLLSNSYRPQLFLALSSTLLTLYLTNSTSFVTRKESGVLAPDFPGAPPEVKDQLPPAAMKRKVMYYVCLGGRFIGILLINDIRLREAEFPKSRQSSLVRQFFLCLPRLLMDVLDRLCYPRLPRWSGVVHQVSWIGTLRCFGSLPWQRGSSGTHRQLYRKYHKSLLREVREQ